MKPSFLRFSWVKAFDVALAAGIAGAIVGSFTLDLWARQRTAYFESAFSEAMKRPVTIERAGFDPLYGFYFQNFSLKEKKTAPRPLKIERLEAHARFSLFPEPTIRVEKLVLLRPSISVDVHPEDLFRSQLWLKRVPYLETKIGKLKFILKLNAVEAYRGRVAIFSRGVRQDFEDVRFFAGKRRRAPQAILFEGRVAGKPQARFKIDCRLRPGASGALQAEARTEFRHFTSAYLAPFLAGRFNLPDRNLNGSLSLVIGEKNDVRVSGRLSLPQPQPNRWSVLDPKPFEARLKLTGRRELERVLFDEFTLRAAGITVYGDGSVVWKKGRESWHAALEAKNVPAEKLPEAWTRPWKFESGSVDFSMRADGDAKRYEPDTRFSLADVRASNRASGIRIDRASGSLRVRRDRVEMRDLWLFYDKTPVRLSGLVVLGENGRAALEGQTYPGQLPSLKEKNAVNASFRLAAKKNAGAWSGALRVRAESGAALAAGSTISLRGWRFHRLRDGRQEITVRHVLVRADGSPEAPFRGPFRIDGLRADVEASPARIEFFLRDGRFENGRLAGLFSWNDSMKWLARLQLRGIEAAGLTTRLGLRHPLSGRLDAAAQVRGDGKRADWSGHFRVRDGRIGPSRELKKLSEDTGIESLHPIRIARFAGRFRSDGDALLLENWKLEGEDLRIAADARLRGGSMAGRVTAHFPLRVVHASSSLAWLANFVGEHDGLDFDFRVAGKIERPRAHWMAGTFREKIEKRLAPWMRAEFTRQIEKRFAEKPPATAAVSP